MLKIERVILYVFFFFFGVRHQSKGANSRMTDNIKIRKKNSESLYSRWNWLYWVERIDNAKLSYEEHGE